MASIIVGERDGLSYKVNKRNGQLISLVREDMEFFHNGGDPRVVPNGWGNSEIVAFPIFGQVSGETAKVNGNDYYLGQHGMARHLPFQSEGSNGLVELVQKYDGQKAIKNLKYANGGSEPKEVTWLAYTLVKTFWIENNSLICELKIQNDSEEEMPYVIGWHPGFNPLGSAKAGIFVDDNGAQIATLGDVASSQDPSKGAYLVRNMTALTYINIASRMGINVSANFGDDTLLWCPGLDKGMFCIENATKFPPGGKMDYFDERLNFEKLAPQAESRKYTVRLTPQI